MATLLSVVGGALVGAVFAYVGSSSIQRRSQARLTRQHLRVDCLAYLLRWPGTGTTRSLTEWREAFLELERQAPMLSRAEVRAIFRVSDLERAHYDRCGAAWEDGSARGLGDIPDYSALGTNTELMRAIAELDNLIYRKLGWLRLRGIQPSHPAGGPPGLKEKWPVA